MELRAMPSLFSLYRKIFFGRKPGWDQQPLPQLKVSTPAVALHSSNVEDYAEVCGFTFDGKVLPPTYLHVLVFRLHATLFTNDAVTFPLLGLIHLRNRIECVRPVTIDEVVRLECSLNDSRDADAGLEFDVYAEVFVGDEVVWRSVSTYLYRTGKPSRRTRPPKASDMPWDDAVFWHLGEDLGRKYAKVSGDYNLIHLHPLLSKRFGFDRILIHGMWSKARSVAEVMPQLHYPFAVDVSFKLPLFMPATVSFGAQDTPNGMTFELRDEKGRRPHLFGTIEYLTK